MRNNLGKAIWFVAPLDEIKCSGGNHNLFFIKMPNTFVTHKMAIPFTHFSANLVKYFFAFWIVSADKILAIVFFSYVSLAPQNIESKPNFNFEKLVGYCVGEFCHANIDNQ